MGGLQLHDDVAVGPGAHAQLAPPLGDRPVGGPARAAQQVARLDRRLADVVGGECRGGRVGAAGADGLVDVDVMRHRALEESRLAEAGLAHHPRYEGGRPRVAPARADAARPAPGVVLLADYPAALRRDRPVAGDGGGHAGRLGPARPPPAAPARPVRAGLLERLVDDDEPEERPLLHREGDDAPPDLVHRGRAARRPADPHGAGFAGDPRRRRGRVEDVGRQAVEPGRLRAGGCSEREGEHGDERLHGHRTLRFRSGSVAETGDSISSRESTPVGSPRPSTRPGTRLLARRRHRSTGPKSGGGRRCFVAAS